MDWPLLLDRGFPGVHIRPYARREIQDATTFGPYRIGFKQGASTPK
jgi:hypothetical protein